MQKEHLYKKIEDYLNGRLPDDELKAFEAELTSDASLSAEVDLHRQLHSELAKPNKKLFRDNLKIISAKQQINLDEPVDVIQEAEPNKKTWLLWLLLGAILVAALWFFMKDKDMEPPVIEQQKELFEEKEKIEEMTPVETEIKKNIPQANNEKTEGNPQSSKPLIASANPKDFLPNQLLEDQMASQVRGEDYSVGMEEMAMAEKIILNGEVANLRLKGTLRANDELPEGAAFLLRIYTNKKEDYLNDRSILNVPINLQTLKEDAFPFQFNANLRITPGLYYYVIVEQEDDEPLYVGRFEVEAE